MEETDDSTSRRASEQSADCTETKEAAKSSRETTEPNDVKTNGLLVVSPSAESQEVGAIDGASSSTSCRQHKRTKLDQKMGCCSSTAVLVDDKDSDREDDVVRKRKISPRTQLSLVDEEPGRMMDVPPFVLISAKSQAVFPCRGKLDSVLRLIYKYFAIAVVPFTLHEPSSCIRPRAHELSNFAELIDNQLRKVSY